MSRYAKVHYRNGITFLCMVASLLCLDHLRMKRIMMSPPKPLKHRVTEKAVFVHDLPIQHIGGIVPMDCAVEGGGEQAHLLA